MKQIKATELLKKYIAGNCNEAEKALLESWYLNRELEDFPDLNTSERLSDLDQVWLALEAEHANPKKIVLWPRIVAAAMTLIVLGTGLLFYFKTSTQQTTVYTNHIVPGKNTATLILANGHKIILSDVVNGELAEEAGISITKTKDGQVVYKPSRQARNQTSGINTLTTAKGEQYQVNLPDGTKIWLNAASSLKYPASFATLKFRRVELSGEAYFEVAKDKIHPFVVKTDQQEVEVLGTHFNINSYKDEPEVKTTLLEGSVKIVSLWNGEANGNSTILVPGQQSSLTNHILKVTAVDTDGAVAWKDGQFMFDNDNLETIMRKISRWYNVEVEYKNEQVKAEVFSGKISRFENIEKVLKAIDLTEAVKFKIEGRKVIVMK